MSEDKQKTMGEALLDEGCMTLTELLVIDEYKKEYNSSILAVFIRSQARQSKQMRDFIADVLEGEIKRPKGQRTSTIERDTEIWMKAQHLKRTGKPLNGDAKEDSITKILGEEFHLSKEAILKAIKRVDDYFLENDSAITKDGRVVFSPRYLSEARQKATSVEKDS